MHIFDDDILVFSAEFPVQSPLGSLLRQEFHTVGLKSIDEIGIIFQIGETA